jgi:hypothetical protein
MDKWRGSSGIVQAEVDVMANYDGKPYECVANTSIGWVWAIDGRNPAKHFGYSYQIQVPREINTDRLVEVCKKFFSEPGFMLRFTYIGITKKHFNPDGVWGMDRRRYNLLYIKDLDTAEQISTMYKLMVDEINII